MKIIKVNATKSTNTLIKEGLRSGTINKTICVWALEQTDGKGQRGSAWKSKSGENLTFSIFFKVPKEIQPTPFAKSMIVALAIHKVLKSYNLPQLKIKWPNDIMSANKKIGGILIENSYQNAVLSETVIGIGINVNQTKFENLPKASSIKNILDISLRLETVLTKITNELEKSFTNYQFKDFATVKTQFETQLFRNKKPSTFIAEGNEFTGIIKGVTDKGLLKILQENGVLKEYDLKEVELRY